MNFYDKKIKLTQYLPSCNVIVEYNSINQQLC